MNAAEGKVEDAADRRKPPFKNQHRQPGKQPKNSADSNEKTAKADNHGNGSERFARHTRSDFLAGDLCFQGLKRFAYVFQLRMHRQSLSKNLNGPVIVADIAQDHAKSG